MARPSWVCGGVVAKFGVVYRQMDDKKNENVNKGTWRQSANIASYRFNR